jgi:hypothetical protein
VVTAALNVTQDPGQSSPGPKNRAQSPVTVRVPFLNPKTGRYERMTSSSAAERRGEGAYRGHAVGPLSVARLQPLHALHVLQHFNQLADSEGVHLGATNRKTR